jgi:hypothetical protein
MIFELQAVDPSQPSGFTGIGWTWVNLFFEGSEICYGKWNLPVYAGATRPDLTSNALNLKKAANVSLCVRIGLPGDQILKEEVDVVADTSQYIIPIYHQRGKAQDASP